MANIIIENNGVFSGTMEGEPLDFSTTTAEVTIVTGLTATKTADKAYWINGELTYVIILRNDNVDIPFENGTFVDTLDSRITLVENSVLVKGATHPYTFINNVLTIANLPTVDSNLPLAIVFRVVQV